MHTLESSSNKIEQPYTIDNANEMYYNPFPLAQKLYPHFWTWIFTLHKWPFIQVQPPPLPPDNDRVCDHNAMWAFPQEKISHYTTGSVHWSSVHWSSVHWVLYTGFCTLGFSILGFCTLGSADPVLYTGFSTLGYVHWVLYTGVLYIWFCTLKRV